LFEEIDQGLVHAFSSYQQMYRSVWWTASHKWFCPRTLKWCLFKRVISRHHSSSSMRAGYALNGLYRQQIISEMVQL
jgi:hypothetical protein